MNMVEVLNRRVEVLMNPKAAISLNNLSKTYPGGTQRAVDSLSLEIADGEVFTLLGPSGCGKSTTLRMVAGLEEPDNGAIYFGDKPVVDFTKDVYLPPEKRDIGMVFQSYAIWPHMTVEENVAFPLRARKCARNLVKGKVAKALELVGMSGMEKRAGPLLSGGQQQRVALARASDGAQHPPARRTIQQSGCQAARANAHRGQAAAETPQHRRAVRDARPGRGAQPL